MDNNEIKEKVRHTLIELRKANNLTQTEVGRLVGKSKNAVATWEQGGSLPDIATLYQLANYYNKSIGYMYGERSD